MAVRSCVKILGGTVLAVVIAAPMAALAAHGKVGLWQVTTTMKMAGMAMPHISAAERARMKAMGVNMPDNHTVTTQHCMTQAEVDSDALDTARPPGSDCKVTNKSMRGQSFSADMVCTGQMKGKGHIMVRYDRPEHYTGKMTFSGTSGGQMADVTNTFEGKWLSADCGNVHR